MDHHCLLFLAITNTIFAYEKKTAKMLNLRCFLYYIAFHYIYIVSDQAFSIIFNVRYVAACRWKILSLGENYETASVIYCEHATLYSSIYIY